MNKRKRIRIYIKIICAFFVIFSIVAFLGVWIAHKIVFDRVDYEQYDREHYLLYSDLDEKQYPRDILQIQSGKNILTAYLYGANNSNGLIIISPGHTDASDIKLYEITFFVDNNWKVLCYDYTGCYNSQGSSMAGYTQSVHDLDAVLTYVETSNDYQDIPIVLFGHSLGGYASAAVLQYKHSVNAAIIASGFDTPKEQWTYSIERYTGVFHYVLRPFTAMFISFKYGKEQNLSAVDGINSVDIPILVISGSHDIFYGGDSPIYRQRNNITNPNCIFEYKTETNHNGHYDYSLTDEALEYQSLVNDETFTGEIDKILYCQHDTAFMKSLNDFLLEAISQNYNRFVEST